jgi:putative FmdB family regulatory protein
MPTYEYECASCGHRFEVFQRFSDEPTTLCQKCGHDEVRRVFYPVGIIFKGSGWYCTDNRKSGLTTTSTPAASTAPTNGDGKQEKKESVVKSDAGKTGEVDKVSSDAVRAS